MSFATPSRAHRLTARAVLASTALVSLVFGPAITTAASPIPASLATVSTVPATVDATGATDVTQALRAFFSSVPNGQVAQLAKDALYRVEGTLKLENRHFLTIDGNNATIFATAKTSVANSHLWIEGGSNLVVRRLSIRGANRRGGTDEEAYVRKLENLHGIRIAGAISVEIADVTVTNVFGDFVYIGRAEDRAWSEDIWIHDSRFARNGRQGIALTAARRVVIERNQLSDMRRATIDLEPNTRSSGVEDVFVLDNHVGPGRLRFIAAHGGGPVDRVVVARNTLRGQTFTVDVKPPGEDRRSSFFVVDNTSNSTSGRAPLKFFRIDGLVVSGNIQPVRDKGVGIDLVGVCGVLIVGNTFSEKGPPAEGMPQPDCGQPPSPELPSAPAIAGRAAGSAITTTTPPPPPLSTTTTFSNSSTPPVTIPPGSQPGADAPGSAPRWPWVLAIAAMGTATVFAIRRARGQRSASNSEKQAS